MTSRKPLWTAFGLALALTPLACSDYSQQNKNATVDADSQTSEMAKNNEDERNKLENRLEDLEKKADKLKEQAKDKVASAGADAKGGLNEAMQELDQQKN